MDKSTTERGAVAETENFESRINEPTSDILGRLLEGAKKDIANKQKVDAERRDQERLEHERTRTAGSRRPYGFD
jgi:hypothetical protein